MRKVAIVGAGLGGLSTAIRLAAKGYDVTVFEKNDRVGGKMNTWSSNGYTFDTGPTLLTMPFILKDLFSSVHKRLEEYVQLVPADPICRYHFSDQSVLNIYTDMEKTESEIRTFSPLDVEGCRRFLSHGKKIYDAASGPFLFSPFGSWDTASLFSSLKFLPAVARLDAFRTLNEAVESNIRDQRLRQVFNRFATYNGSSPYKAPATLAIIPYIEFMMGGWYVRGGMYRLALALERLARELGVTIHCGCGVRRVNIVNGIADGVELEGGERMNADVVVTNADAFYVKEHLLPANGDSGRYVGPGEMSMSGFALLLGVNRTYPHLSHHNIFFSADYRGEFETLFEEHLPSDHPTVYVNISSVSDPSHAPAGSSNMFVLVNVPPLETKNGRGEIVGYDWLRKKDEYKNLILSILESKGLENLREHIVVEKVITPLDFQKDYNAFHGSIYGLSSNNRTAAFMRPPNRYKNIKRLYLTGGSAHPGGGIPLVLLSGKIVSDLVSQDCV